MLTHILFDKKLSIFFSGQLLGVIFKICLCLVSILLVLRLIADNIVSSSMLIGNVFNVGAMRKEI